MIRILFAFLLATSGAPVSSAAITQTPQCNHLVEQPGQGPGKIAGSEIIDDCVQLNINGNLITPAQCKEGYVHFSIQQHSCGVAAPGVHCDFDKYQVTITEFSDGGCPQVPDLSDIDWTTLGGWLGALPRIRNSLVCQPMKRREEKSDSAGSKRCPTSEADGPVEGQVLVQTTEGVAVWGGEQPQAAEGPAGSINPFMTPSRSAETLPAESFDGPLGALAVAQGGVDGMKFRASLTVEHDSGAGAHEPSSVREIALEGRMCADGRFDVSTVLPATYDGKPSPTLARTTFDGRYLRSTVADSETGNLYDLGADVAPWVRDVHFEGLDDVYMWCLDPYDITLFPGVSYSVGAGTVADTLVLERTHPLVGGGSFVSESYTLSTRVAPPVPIRRAEFDVAGFAWTTVEYSNYVAFRPSDLRPSTTRTTRFFGPEHDRRKVVSTLRITSAVPLSAEDALLVPDVMPDDTQWVRWTF